MPATLDPDIDVPAGETPAAECQYCGRPFDSKRARDLHVGRVHAEEATETERDELFFYHIRVVVALGVIYSVLVIVYMAALGSGFL